MTTAPALDMADVIALLLFAVPPSDRALTGWGLGSQPFNTLQGLAQMRPAPDPTAALRDAGAVVHCTGYRHQGPGRD